jgi:hypothetical protein
LHSAFLEYKRLFSTLKTLYVVNHNAGVEAANLIVVGLAPGANPTVVSYNAGVLKIYSATNSIARF